MTDDPWTPTTEDRLLAVAVYLADTGRNIEQMCDWAVAWHSHDDTSRPDCLRYQVGEDGWTVHLSAGPDVRGRCLIGALPSRLAHEIVAHVEAAGAAWLADGCPSLPPPEPSHDR